MEKTFRKQYDALLEPDAIQQVKDLFEQLKDHVDIVTTLASLARGDYDHKVCTCVLPRSTLAFECCVLCRSNSQGETTLLSYHRWPTS